MFDTIVQKLKDIEEQRQIKLLYVAESGSRAWGFASTDSDYDVRGIFIYPKDQYLSLDPAKDALSWIEDTWFDVGLWDLKKSLRLLRKTNTSLIEWLQSPIVYYQYQQTQKDLLTLAEQHFSPRAALYHYRGIAKTTQNGMQADKLSLKKWFYVLRNLLSASWIAQHNTIPPMTLEQLLVLLPNDIQQKIKALVLFKADKEESFLWTPTASLKQLIHHLWQQTDILMPADDIPGNDTLNAYFRKTLYGIDT